MFGGFRVDEQIDASPTEVWRHLTDFKNAPVWMPGVEELISIEGEPLTSETRLIYKTRSIDQVIEVSVIEPETKLVLISIMGGVFIYYTYLLERSDSGTHISLGIKSEAMGAWRLIQPLVGFGVKKSDGKQLVKLKRVVEAE